MFLDPLKSLFNTADQSDGLGALLSIVANPRLRSYLCRIFLSLVASWEMAELETDCKRPGKVLGTEPLLTLTPDHVYFLWLRKPKTSRHGKQNNLLKAFVRLCF